MTPNELFDRVAARTISGVALTAQLRLLLALAPCFAPLREAYRLALLGAEDASFDSATDDWARQTALAGLLRARHWQRRGVSLRGRYCEVQFASL
jgi:hypothetical protein